MATERFARFLFLAALLGDKARGRTEVALDVALFAACRMRLCMMSLIARVSLLQVAVAEALRDKSCRRRGRRGA